MAQAVWQQMRVLNFSRFMAPYDLHRHSAEVINILVFTILMFFKVLSGALRNPLEQFSGGCKEVLALYRWYQALCSHYRHHSPKIVSQHVQAHFGTDVFLRFIRKWVAPIHILMVPNGCSTVCFLITGVSGSASNRAASLQYRLHISNGAFYEVRLLIGCIEREFYSPCMRYD